MTRATQSDGAPSVERAGVPSARVTWLTCRGRSRVLTCPQADQLRPGARTLTSPKGRTACTRASRPGALTPSSLVTRIRIIHPSVSGKAFEERLFFRSGQERGTRGGGNAVLQGWHGQPQVFARRAVLTAEGDLGNAGVVGVEGDVEPGVEHAQEGVLRQRGHDAGLNVGGEADLEGNLAAARQFDDGGVFEDAHAVPDALCTEQFNCLADAARPRPLAGVDVDAQPGGAGAFKDAGKRGSVEVCLIAGEVEADNAHAGAPGGFGEGLFGEGDRFVAVDACHQAHLHAVGGGCLVGGFNDSVDNFAQPDPRMASERHGGEEELEVEDAVCGGIGDHLAGEALDDLEGAEEEAQGGELGEEGGRVVGVGGLHLDGALQVGGDGDVVEGGKRAEGFEAQGALEVAVEFHLGEGCVECLLGGGLVVWHGRLRVLYPKGRGAKDDEGGGNGTDG